jgi:hypothetical protein
MITDGWGTNPTCSSALFMGVPEIVRGQGDTENPLAKEKRPGVEYLGKVSDTPGEVRER